MKGRFIKVAELRKLEGQVSLGEITYSKMIELLNEKAEAWRNSKCECKEEVGKEIGWHQKRICNDCSKIIEY